MLRKEIVFLILLILIGFTSKSLSQDSDTAILRSWIEEEDPAIAKELGNGSFQWSGSLFDDPLFGKGIDWPLSKSISVDLVNVMIPAGEPLLGSLVARNLVYKDKVFLAGLGYKNSAVAVFLTKGKNLSIYIATHSHQKNAHLKRGSRKEYSNLRLINGENGRNLTWVSGEGFSLITIPRVRWGLVDHLKNEVLLPKSKKVTVHYNFDESNFIDLPLVLN